MEFYFANWSLDNLEAKRLMERKGLDFSLVDLSELSLFRNFAEQSIRHGPNVRRLPVLITKETLYEGLSEIREYLENTA